MGSMDTVTCSCALARWSSMRLPPGWRISAREPVCRQTVLKVLGGGEFVGGPLPVGGAVGVEGVGGLAGLVEGGDGEGAGLGGGHAAAQVDAGVAEAAAEERAEDVMGEPPEEARGSTEPGKGDGGVGGAATGQGAQGEFARAGQGGVGEGVGDALTEDGDTAGGLESSHGTVCLSGKARGAAAVRAWALVAGARRPGRTYGRRDTARWPNAAHA